MDCRGRRFGMTKKLLLVTTSVAALFVLTPAYAAVWDFGTAFGTGVQGSSKQYTADDGTSKLTASGFQDVVAPAPPPAATFMNIKNLGTDEAGLGILGFSGLDTDNEIIPGTFIQLHFDTPISSASISFQAQSTTSPDAWHVFGTNTAGSLAGATSLASCNSAVLSTCENLMNFSTMGFSFVDVTADAGDILLREINAAAVPAPIVGAGLPGLIAACGAMIGLARRRRQRTA
jgi:hypothetical protein